MRKFMMTLGVVMLMAAVLTVQPRRSFADDSIEGDVAAKIYIGSECRLHRSRSRALQLGPSPDLGQHAQTQRLRRASMPASPPRKIPPSTSSCAATPAS